MFKKIILSGFVLSTCFILISAIHKSTSNGAPTSSTGAPSEQSCGMTNCHDDRPINKGTAEVSLEIGNFSENKLNGIPVKIKINDIGKIRFGFELTALDESHKKIGKFIITDSLRTQILNDNVNLPDREYLTYTYFGTLGTKSGEAIWEAIWQPSEKDLAKPGKVTFYLGALSANNDGEDKGDDVYTKSADFSWEITTKTNHFQQVATLGIKLQKNELFIHNNENNYIQSVSITDLNGTIILEKWIKDSESFQNITLPEMVSGLLIVNVKTSKGTVTQKLFSTHD